MKRSLLLTVLVIGLALPGVRAAAAQPSPVEKAIEGVKDKLDELVGAKDEKNPNELAYRVGAFRKVVDFSIAEANDLKVKLLGGKVEKDAEPWRAAAAKRLDAALDYYAKEKERLEDEEQPLDLAGVRAAAESFRDWRGAHFLPAADAVRDFLLITQEEKAIEVAQKRAQRIGEDVQKLTSAKVKVAKDLGALLEKANGLIGEAVQLNETARERFRNDFIVPAAATSSTSTAETATQGGAETSATSTEPAPETAATSSPAQPEATAMGATSTTATTTAAAPPPPSIRDLVKGSLTKVRDTYQVFIEMSTLVRKALR